MNRLTALLAMLALVFPSAARADDEGPVPGADVPVPSASALEAADLVRAAREQLRQGQVDAACATLDKSAALDRAPETLGELARCREFQGKTKSAYDLHLEASLAFERLGVSEQARVSRDAVSRLAPRLSRMRVHAEPTEGLLVKRNGKLLDEKSLGLSEPLDPGTYVIEAEAPGRVPSRQTVKVAPDGDLQLVTIALAKVPTKQKPKDPEPNKPDERRGTSAIGIVGFVTSGFGLVGVAMGTVFGIETLLDVADAEEDPRLCPKQLCSPAGRRIIDEAEAKGIASTVLFVTGGAALTAGVTVLIVNALDDEETAAPVVVSPWISPSAGGVSLGLSF